MKKYLNFDGVNTVALYAMNLIPTQVFAAGASPTIDVNPPTTARKLGTNVDTLCQFMNFILNVLLYLGGMGVIIGVALAIFALIYKLFSGDSEEAMKNVQGYLTKAVLIVIAGILLVSFGFILRVVLGFFGLDYASCDSGSGAPLLKGG